MKFCHSPNHPTKVDRSKHDKWAISLRFDASHHINPFSKRTPMNRINRSDVRRPMALSDSSSGVHVVVQPRPTNRINTREML